MSRVRARELAARGDGERRHEADRRRHLVPGEAFAAQAQDLRLDLAGAGGVIAQHHVGYDDRTPYSICVVPLALV